MARAKKDRRLLRAVEQPLAIAMRDRNPHKVRAVLAKPVRAALARQNPPLLSQIDEAIRRLEGGTFSVQTDLLQ